MTVEAASSTTAAWLIARGLSPSPADSNGLARFAYGPARPAMRQDFPWAYAEAGWINTANAIGYLIGAQLWLRVEGASAALVAATWGLLGAALMISPSPGDAFWAGATGGGALALACAGTGLDTLLPLLLPGAAGLLLSAAAFGLSFSSSREGETAT